MVHLRNGSYGLIEIKLGGADLINDGAECMVGYFCHFERSAMPFGPSKKSQEISPCATLTSSNSVATRDSQSELCSPLAVPSLSRDDGGGRGRSR